MAIDRRTTKVIGDPSSFEIGRNRTYHPPFKWIRTAA
jgi:hypothetical protein